MKKVFSEVLSMLGIVGQIEQLAISTKEKDLLGTNNSTQDIRMLKGAGLRAETSTRGIHISVKIQTPDVLQRAFVSWIARGYSII